MRIFLSMVEKMLLAHGKKEVCGAILTNLSKASDCIIRDLLIAKLNAYTFDQIIFLEDLRKLMWVLLLVIYWVYITVYLKVPY